MRLTLVLLSLTLAVSGWAAPSSPDAFITSKTKLSLWTTAGVRSTTVRVDTTDGLVTLTGKVPTATQRSLAEKTARQVVGVRSVRNLLQVVPLAEERATAHADAEIKTATEGQLKSDPWLQGTKIVVKSVDKGVVVLSGDARSYTEQLRAIVRVDRVPGVMRIVSEVKTPNDFQEDERITFVRPVAPATTARPSTEPPKHTSSDSRITVEVKMRLLTAAQVPSNEISVDTTDGQVTLFGIVPTAEVKAAAGVEAAAVTGVLQVENELQVVATAAKKAVEARDSDITRDLALVFKGHDEFSGVTSTVKNGTVRLTGRVATGWDQLAALRNARRVAGVRTVENDLTLTDSGS
jgi:hyperosmotically inducible periplasmic protein